MLGTRAGGDGLSVDGGGVWRWLRFGHGGGLRGSPILGCLLIILMMNTYHAFDRRNDQ